MEIFLAVLLVVLAALVVKMVGLSRGNSTNQWPVAPKVVLSRPEQVMYFRLVEALPDHVVLAQVQLARFLQIEGGRNTQAVRNKIDRKSVDFLICSKDFTVVAAIEIDDASHSRPARRKSDADKDAALAAAGVRLVRWEARSLPDTSSISLTLANGGADSSRERSLSGAGRA